MNKKLSIGFSHHDDFDGAWFTIQDIRKELIHNGRKDLLDQIEFVVVENNKTSEHASELKKFLTSTLALERSLVYSIVSDKGSALVKDEVIKIANGKFVLVLDCHVLLCPVVKTIEKIISFIDENPETNDLYNGPLVHDNGYSIFTHLTNEWNETMWGRWSSAFSCNCGEFNFSRKKLENDKFEFRSVETGNIINTCANCGAGLHSQDDSKQTIMMCEDKPFEIFAQGTGCFLVRKEAWLGYNEYARGFGGEECYIHEKFRKSGNKTFCLPFLKWLHRFQRTKDPSYPLENSYKLRNYILEFVELDLDLTPVHKHFVTDNNFDEIVYNSFVREAKYLYNRD